MRFLAVGSDLEIARGITTPIALAALCLLIGAGILKAALKGKANENSRMTIRYGFILALALSVLANISYLVLANFQREVRISGTVRDTAGATVDRAVIDIPGAGRGITDDHGNFQFIIPDVWTSDGYEAVITLKGYQPQRMKLAGKRPPPLDITLQPQTLTADTLISVRGVTLIRHSLGVPIVELPLSFTNPLGSDLTIDQLSLELLGPGNRQLKLWPQIIRIAPNGPALPPIQPITVPANQPVNFIWGFTSPPDAAIAGLAQRADHEFVLPPSQLVTPDPAKTIYTSDVVNDLQAYMKSHFEWETGDWTLAVVCSVDGHDIRRDFHFKLSDDEITRMKAISDLYGSGIGVLAPWMYWQSDAANPTVVVTLTQP